MGYCMGTCCLCPELIRKTLLPAMVDAMEIQKDKRPIKGTKVLNERLFKGNLLTELHNLEQFAEFTLERKRPEFTMEGMAGEMGISRTSVYRLIKSMNGKVKYNVNQYHGEWIEIEGEGK